MKWILTSNLDLCLDLWMISFCPEPCHPRNPRWNESLCIPISAPSVQQDFKALLGLRCPVVSSKVSQSRKPTDQVTPLLCVPSLTFCSSVPDISCSVFYPVLVLGLGRRLERRQGKGCYQLLWILISKHFKYQPLCSKKKKKKERKRNWQSRAADIWI
jgi:hypothetical protein